MESDVVVKDIKLFEYSLFCLGGRVLLSCFKRMLLDYFDLQTMKKLFTTPMRLQTELSGLVNDRVAAHAHLRNVFD
jgi:hypothetical protein